MEDEMKKIIMLTLVMALMTLSLSGCGASSSGTENGSVYVYNWGEYIDPEVLNMFEEETGIKVIYDEFETNEIMYPKIESGASSYDVVCPSDYMIQKLVKEKEVLPIDYSNIPLISNLDSNILNYAQSYDK